MKNKIFCRRNFFQISVLLLVGAGASLRGHANPTGGNVTQGAATFSGSGSQFTINQTTPYAFINWQSFNIGAGEITTFNQPSPSSVVWNFVNDPNASTIDGNLNANGYVILQNPNGFTIGGQAAISTRGLVMTTASTPAIDLSQGGPWSFNTPPPSAKIVNYGQITVANGSSAFLIANDIENHGAISAPGGNVGLYAGQTVLVSTSPDGRGLSAQVTLPQGLVDNEGKLVADAGSVVLQAAQIVNQQGLIQANSAQNVNGTIELLASDSVNLGANSVISAQGDTAGTSAGGSVTIQSGNSYADQSGSVINVAGGTHGGDGGQVTISAPQMSAFQSSINGQANAGYGDGSLSIDTANITVNSDGSLVSGGLALNANASSWFAGLSQINLQASDGIEISSLWHLDPKSGFLGTVSLQAGNAITVDAGAGIAADGRQIDLTAPTVNQLGTLQANSFQGTKGAISINASTAANLGANSAILADEDAADTIAGGSVTIASDTLTLESGATIEANGGMIALNTTTLNQNGIIRADSIQTALSQNGTAYTKNNTGSIAIQAAHAANLNAGSIISANGDAANAGPGGSVTINQSTTITLAKDAAIQADGGTIALNATTVNQDGNLRANSIQNNTGSVDIHGSGSVSLGADSVISANGDSTGVSDGGSVTVQSDNSFSDQSGSVINVAGGAQGGNGGQVTVSAPQMSAFQSSINGSATAGYANSGLSIDTANITLNSDGSLVPGSLALNINSSSWFSGLSQINLQAEGNIELIQNLQWTLGNYTALSLLAGNTLAIDAGAGIEADAGKIALNAPTINQYGTLRADSVGGANGVIDIYASGSGAQLNLGDGLGHDSVLSAQGNGSSSEGGFVVLRSDNAFVATPGSTISVSGTAGGKNGVIEIFGNGATAGTVLGSYLAYLINPVDVYLSSSSTSQNTQPANTNPNASSQQPWANFNVSDLSAYSQIDLRAPGNIELDSAWTLGAQTAPTALSLAAGNNVILNNSLAAGKNWDVKLTAESGAINVNSSLQTYNGDITLDAGNGVTVGSGIRTIGGGNINVTAENGSVNTGLSTSGFNYFQYGNGTAASPYYTPFSISGFGINQYINFGLCSLGGISTAAGGNVTINAPNGDVISLPTTKVTANDSGTGAFGPEAGNVTIKAGGNVYGNYIVMNGKGVINAKNIGVDGNNVALSLAKGSWNLNAQNNIYLQEVRNPNGVFDAKANGGYHLFDYDSQASVTLTAGNGVYFTPVNLPRPNDLVPMILPPILNISAGLGGVNLQIPSIANVIMLDPDIILFPSVYGNLQITTTGSGSLNGNGATLFMSDSAQTQWNPGLTPLPFSELDHGNSPIELNNYDPVVINIAKDMNNLNLKTDKATHIHVGGNMNGGSFAGQNLHSSDVTSITVGGQILNQGSFTTYTLGKDEEIQLAPANVLPPGMINDWATLLDLALNPDIKDFKVPPGTLPSQYASYLQSYYLFSGGGTKYNTGVLNGSFDYYYNLDTKQAYLSFAGTLDSSLQQILDQPLTVVVYKNGYPEVDSAGHFVTTTVTWASPAAIDYLAANSVGNPSLDQAGAGYMIGGTGLFDVQASSISLGNCYGILSVGNGALNGADYSYLTSLLQNNPAATINVTVDKDYTDQNGITQSSLNMPASTIAALGGGDVNVTSTAGSLNLGSQELVDFEGAIMHDRNLGLGIYTTAGGNVNVTALDAINIQSSRIATFNGGDVFVESLAGDVDAGSGGSISVPIAVFSPVASLAFPLGYVYANGIVAETLAKASSVPGAATVPGNITVWTPYGSIHADLGGIKQETLNGTAPIGPVITLIAGTPSVPGEFNSSAPPLNSGADSGNIDLGTVGAIGESIVVKATGTVKGLVLSQHNTDVTSQAIGSLTVLAGGFANVTVQNSGGGQGITIIGGAGVNASGIGAGATLIGQNVSVNGAAATSTLGTSASATAASQSAAGQTSSESQQQVANNVNGNDDEKKKKKKEGLVRNVGRVTVILPKAS